MDQNLRDACKQGGEVEKDTGQGGRKKCHTHEWSSWFNLLNSSTKASIFVLVLHFPGSKRAKTPCLAFALASSSIASCERSILIGKWHTGHSGSRSLAVSKYCRIHSRQNLLGKGGEMCISNLARENDPSITYMCLHRLMIASSASSKHIRHVWMAPASSGSACAPPRLNACWATFDFSTRSGWFDICLIRVINWNMFP